MLITTLLPVLLPLALARPHHPDSIAHRRQAAAARIVERAGAAYDNETQAEISAYQHEHESSTVVVASSSAVDIASSSAVQAVGSALTAVNTPSSAVATSAQSSAVVEQSSAAAASPSPTEEAVTSQEAQPSPSAEAQVVVASSSTEEASTAPTSTARTVQTKVVTASRSSTVVQVTASASASASASAAAASTDEKIAGLPKTTFIAIIVVAAVVALAGIGWTVFRKSRLGPSRKFDEKMRPIDFSPHNDTFLEKSHHRSSSNSSAAMQRDEFIAELDSKHVDGVPDHDFTAGGNMAGQGAYEDYHQDPYASAEAYEYDAAYHYDDVAQQHQYDQPTQDTGAGYTDLQRGNSIGSGSGHGHHQASYPVEQFPMPDHYLGRPTGGAEGPYAQASHRY